MYVIKFYTFLLLIYPVLCLKSFAIFKDVKKSHISNCLEELFEARHRTWKEIVFAMDNNEGYFYIENILKNKNKVITILNYPNLINNVENYKKFPFSENVGIFIIITIYNPYLFNFLELIRYKKMDIMLIFDTDISNYDLKQILDKSFNLGLHSTLAIIKKDENILITRLFHKILKNCTQTTYLKIDPYTTLINDDIKYLFDINDKPNYNKCPVNVSTMEIPPSAMIDHKTGKVIGFETEIVYTLANVMNFTPKFIYRKKLQWGMGFPNNNSGTGIIGDVYTGKSEICYGVIWPSFHRKEYLDDSITYESDCFTWAVPPYIIRSDLYSSTLGSLLKGISIPTWKGILITLLITPLILFIILKVNNIKCEFSTCVYLVFEMLVQKPFPNAFIGTIISLKFLLIFWYFYSYVITTMYCGRLASSIILPINYLHIENMKELIKSNIPLATTDDFKTSIDILDDDSIFLEVKRRVKIRLPPSKYLLSISNGQWMAYSRNLRTLIYYRDKHYKKGKCSCRIFRIMHNCYLRYPINLLFRKGSVMTRRANKIITRVKEGGLIAYWIPHILKRGTKWDIIFNTNFKPQNLEKIIYVFYLYIFGVLLAFFVFIFEFLFSKFQKKYLRTRQGNPFL